MDYIFMILASNFVMTIIFLIWLKIDYNYYYYKHYDFADYFEDNLGAFIIILLMGISLNAIPFIGTIAVLIALIIYNQRNYLD